MATAVHTVHVEDTAYEVTVTYEKSHGKVWIDDLSFKGDEDTVLWSMVLAAVRSLARAGAL